MRARLPPQTEVPAEHFRGPSCAAGDLTCQLGAHAACAAAEAEKLLKVRVLLRQAPLPSIHSGSDPSTPPARRTKCTFRSHPRPAGVSRRDPCPPPAPEAPESRPRAPTGSDPAAGAGRAASAGEAAGRRGGGGVGVGGEVGAGWGRPARGGPEVGGDPPAGGRGGARRASGPARPSRARVPVGVRTPPGRARGPPRRLPARPPAHLGAVYAVRGRLARSSGASRGDAGPGGAGRAGGPIFRRSRRGPARTERDIRYIVGIPRPSRDRRVTAARPAPPRPPGRRGRPRGPTAAPAPPCGRRVKGQGGCLLGGQAPGRAGGKLPEVTTPLPAPTARLPSCSGDARCRRRTCARCTSTRSSRLPCTHPTPAHLRTRSRPRRSRPRLPRAQPGAHLRPQAQARPRPLRLAPAWGLAALLPSCAVKGPALALPSAI